jgi:hypothetical protein
MGTPRTDYMSIEEFRKRANERLAAGWTPILPKQVVAITPTFNGDFDKFAASVAYEIRHYVVYRSDGGNFARGLVRATGELAIIHEELKAQKYPDGTKITLAAALYRRSHAEPTSRWMMSIKFGRIAIRPDESEKVTASEDITRESDRNLAERIFNWMDQAGNEPSWTGDGKKRIGDWAKLARSMGYPKFLELWHYNRAMVALFVQVQNFTKHRAMTGGKSPPYSGSYLSIPWRVYPFKAIMAECKKRTNIDECYPVVANQLMVSERDLLAMIDDVYKATTKLGVAFGQDTRPDSWTGSPDAKYGPLAAFLKDLKKQLNDVQTLMGTYTKYTQSKPGMWDSF